MSDIASNLTEVLQTALRRYPATGALWLGYSGGLDSSVLLHLLATAKIPFTALHIHHGLSAQADAWLVHCETEAARLGVPFVAMKVEVDGKRGGVEQGARDARYAAFIHKMGARDQVLLAQHGDDQSETFLLRLLRGAGVLGLGGMVQQRGIGASGEGKSLLRPLLGVSRAELEQYAAVNELRWVEDDSNADVAYDRNYLRSQVAPALKARWPLNARVAQACENLREAAGLLEELAGEDLSRCGVREESFGGSIGLTVFRDLSVPRQKNLLRGWLASLGAQMPEAAHLGQALSQLEARDDAVIEVPLGERVLRRYRDRLYLTPQLPRLELVAGEGEWSWDGVVSLALPGGWTLSPSRDWPAGEYSVRFRSHGERARPRERHHSQTLKKLLQEYGLPPWLRDQVPLVSREGTLLAVGDLFVTEEGPPKPPIWTFLD
ncbi:tRNA lysidine(34) synthetase TilS [Microbulbifer agarilyticus]|uniref:tRNA lysidine(34) synthetase TilS n=1 Tax=Microbulbifer agarilyticus TaxID=260552 RepID=UPI001C969245|nr:tRNA lysidine(34) synthetase TilS [Microbulbifer agarilyticus]MBY6188857.1 tRNA lysidine(34) synthetase TilS [Microbulbifer agarilyticus]